MKEKLLVFLIALPFFTLAQVVSIPDSNFKFKLLQSSPSNSIAKNSSGNAIAIDSNGNGEIETQEALQVFKLDVNNQDSPVNAKIVSLSGIAAFQQLRTLNCNANLLSQLNLQSLTNLTHLACKNNQISSLNITPCPQIQWLEGQNNQLSSLLFGANGALVYLNLSGNAIHTFSTQGLSGLSQFDISNNPLNTLLFNNTFNLSNVQASQTLINQLDVSNLTNLSVLNVDNNPNLQQLYLKNNSFESGLSLTNTPQLSFICTDDNPTEISSIQFLVTMYSGSAQCVVNPYCSFQPGGTCFSLKGAVRFDANIDGCSVDDPLVPKINLKLIRNNQEENQYGTSVSGNYSMYVNEGNYSIEPIVEHPEYYTITPSLAQLNFPLNLSPFTQDFCLAYNGNHNDLEIIAVPINTAVPGYTTTYKIICKNKGTTTQTATVTWNFNAQLANLSSTTPAATFLNANQIAWTVNSIAPFETREFIVSHLLQTPLSNPSLQAGAILNFTANVNSMSDEFANDNQFELKQTVVNSFDPNYKFCLEGTSISTEKVGDFVHYMIRFENLGTAPARNIVITDIIDGSKLDLSSLVILDSSHPYDSRIHQNNQVEFIFENINLPTDDASNDGFILFKIRTKSSLSIGDSFSNTASIYFDYNAPIITNTYTTTVNALQTQENLVSHIQLAPNPAHDFVALSTGDFISAEIYDTSGRLVAVKPIIENRITISELSNGHYILRLLSNTSKAVIQFQKQ
ncbi:MAG: hypothetical protein RLZZ500_106 [Bacteroidota bacterium]|jgi:uncharacterized repeat protein (TIGR01451 family)